jgi:hypothetical protein
VRDAAMPIEYCIIDNLKDVCTSDDDCFIRSP